MVMIPFTPPLNADEFDFADVFNAAQPAVSLPSETIDHILSYIDYGFESKPGDAPPDSWSSERGVRNSDLALAARINSQWKEMAYSRLYRHLKIEWRFTTSPLLIRSFDENPALYALVSTVDVVRVLVPRYNAQALQSRMDSWRKSSLEEVEQWGEAVAHGWITFETFQERVRDKKVALEEEGEEFIRLAKGDFPWLDQGTREGSDAMWGWLAGFAKQRLTKLELRSFSCAMPDTPRVDSVLAGLRSLVICGPGLPPKGLLFKVPAIEELHLNSCTPWDDGVEPEPIEPEPVADEGGHLPAGTLNSLKRFWSSSTEASRQVFLQKPLNLEHVSLRDWEDDEDVSGLTPLLPLLTELKSLRLNSTFSSVLSSEFLSALSSSSVQDLTSNVLPADRIAPHLPAALGTLHLTTRRTMGDPTQPYDLETLLSASLWRKTTAARNLRCVTIVIPSLAARTDVAATRKHIEEITQAASRSGLELSVREL